MRLIACIAVMAMLFVPIGMSAPVSGAIFTTNSTCTGVNLNIYASKDDVYLDGGPAHPGAAGLPDGSYYVQVTEPGGTVLGKSLTPVVTVSGGEFASCYQLSAIVLSTSSGFTAPGFDDTSNAGGEYKVWVSNVSTFDNDSSKTDNFKVKTSEPPNPPKLHVRKFYDANANGINDDGQLITGWKIRIQDNIDYIRFTPVDITLDADTYYVSECTPLQTNWVATTPNPLTVPLNYGDDTTVYFGNVCLGPGGGLTLGFWSNKNGANLFNAGASDLALMVSLNLRNPDGSNYDPASYLAFRTWLLSATATNMSYMLSAQLAATRLDVAHGFVNGSALIYAPGTASANPLGFASVNAVVAEANTELGVHGLVLSGNSFRSYQERLKNALDNANNNRSFVQPAPCPFSFAP